MTKLKGNRVIRDGKLLGILREDGNIYDEYGNKLNYRIKRPDNGKAVYSNGTPNPVAGPTANAAKTEKEPFSKKIFILAGGLALFGVLVISLLGVGITSAIYGKSGKNPFFGNLLPKESKGVEISCTFKDPYGINLGGEDPKPLLGGEDPKPLLGGEDPKPLYVKVQNLALSKDSDECTITLKYPDGSKEALVFSGEDIIKDTKAENRRDAIKGIKNPDNAPFYRSSFWVDSPGVYEVVVKKIPSQEIVARKMISLVHVEEVFSWSKRLKLEIEESP